VSIGCVVIFKLPGDIFLFLRGERGCTTKLSLEELDDREVGERLERAATLAFLEGVAADNASALCTLTSTSPTICTCTSLIVDENIPKLFVKVL
jgi:hypothetical protein